MILIIKINEFNFLLLQSSSLLERHHCQTTKAILGESQLLSHLPEAEKLEILGLIEDFILSTDFSRHKHFMTQFEEMLVSERHLDLTKPVERHFMLMVSCIQRKNSLLLYKYYYSTYIDNLLIPCILKVPFFFFLFFLFLTV